MNASVENSRPGSHAWVSAPVILAATMWFAPAAAQTTPQLACPSCEDYNACTIDSCDEATGTCRHDPLDCDDHNPCTTDTCTRFTGVPNAGCGHFNKASGTVCDDGDTCTTADVCNGFGTCVAQMKAPGASCDDGNPCTADDICGAAGTCSGAPLLQGAECDDRNTCTRGERCVVATDGTIGCQAPARNCDDGLLCTIDSCDPISGDCVHAAASCNDGNPCTVDACDPLTGACGRTTREGSCDDANICTVNDFCQGGNCVGGGVGNCGWGGQCGNSFCIPQEQRCLQDISPTGCPPAGGCGNRYECRNGFCAFVQGAGPLPCSDGNPCTVEFCVRGTCTLQLILTGSACNDGSLCTQGDVCRTNSQCAGTPTCSDGNACTDDTCDAATGACLGSQPKNCDDGNPCTTDSCDPATGCLHVLNSDPCDDQNACTTGDVCAAGTCRGTPAVNCPDDGNVCTDDFCDPATGACVRRNNTNFCNDPVLCTINDRCLDGTCQPGQPRICNDSNVCTADSCSTATGTCFFNPAAGPCSDNNACTTGDTCANGTCAPGSPTNCDDGNPCTTDGCSVISGCFHTPLAGPCNDGNPCTTGDSCQAGACRPAAAVSCIDGNACTIDDCDRATGDCVHESTSVDCDDGDACTIDRCDPATGTCLGREPLDCDDGNACTTDGCSTPSGCHHTAATGPCDDGDPCTTDDTCRNGSCEPGSPRNCDDSNVCTGDSCDSASGICVFRPAAGPCSDDDVCTIGDICVDGTCMPGSNANCDDAIDCTRDACDPATGCTHEPVCPQEVVDIALSNSSPFGHGSGTLTWRTTLEFSVQGFNILAVSPQGTGTRLNLALIPCTECVTLGSASYLFIVPKHKGGKGIFVQMIGRDGGVLGTFGPAVKSP